MAPRKIKQYQHSSQERLNNPPAGLVSTDTEPPGKVAESKTVYKYDSHIDPALEFDPRRAEIENFIDAGLAADSLESARAALAELKKRQRPYLNWAGKAERTSFDVPTVSLHVHERIDPRTIIKAVRSGAKGTANSLSEPVNEPSIGQLPLFERPTENLPRYEAVEFYKHRQGWSNRLIAGDSLLVMNSLLEKEGMAGKLQMVYIDPPYGIRYGSNFQPFVNKRVVQDGKGSDLTSEPEMLRAFKDTWELGIHSWLAYLRDRLRLSKELLADTGAVFVQIGDENVHHARELLDEIFGRNNFISSIVYRKTSPLGTTGLPNISDFVLWYAKDRTQVKYRQLFEEKPKGAGTRYSWIELPDGTRRRATREESVNPRILPSGTRFFVPDKATAAGLTPSCVYPVQFEGKIYNPHPNSSWSTNPQGMAKLIEQNRIFAPTENLAYVRYHDDFPVQSISNIWNDTTTGGFNDPKVYVVQTVNKVIERCMLMASDPGDIIFDPTSGSGTTAVIAEQWGRRWITCDTSRVAITLAKQRLMTTGYDYYELARPDEGVGSGFKYKTVSHTTLRSIVTGEAATIETLYDDPLVDESKVRVTGPFTVEAVPSASVISINQELNNGQGVQAGPDIASTAEIMSRSGVTAHSAQWRDELLKTGIRTLRGEHIQFSRVEPVAGNDWLHAEAEIKDSGDASGKLAVVTFGPDNAPMGPTQVELSINRALEHFPRPAFVVFAAFQFDPEAAKDIDQAKVSGITLLKAQMNADLLTEDLKKKRSSNESFWLVGQPDVEIEKIASGGEPQFKVSVRGFDYYDTRTGQMESGGAERIAMWMLDPDYDNRSLYPRQVFFPMAGNGQNDGWNRLGRTLNAEIDLELIEAYRGVVSLPFTAGARKQAAVKIIDDRGIESLRVIALPGV